MVDPGSAQLRVAAVCFAVILVCVFTAVFVWQPQAIQSNGRSLFRSNQPRRILVTGAAGFVGFHVAKTLAAEPDNQVIGMDNFNDYYDVQLKIDRAYELHKLGIQVHHADLCDVKFLENLFATSNFTNVVHLGAQAGVRYSLENPLAYVHSNIEGHQAVLDIIRKYPNIHLTYASSSSVYGKESDIPFRLTANTDRPGNMYAATKRANELMCYQHCSDTGVKSVGLRFFTVYGPWGRPDMAVYKFAESILDGKKVPMFHVSDDKPLGRDFTYIDDIVAGVLSAMDYHDQECGAVFNLGYGHPVSVPQLVKILEQELKMPAQIAKLPLPPTEILQTWADVDVSTEQLGFSPKTDLPTGVKEFVSWFKAYRKERKHWESKSEKSDSQKWYDGILAEAGKRNTISEIKSA